MFSIWRHGGFYRAFQRTLKLKNFPSQGTESLLSFYKIYISLNYSKLHIATILHYLHKTTLKVYFTRLQEYFIRLQEYFMQLQVYFIRLQVYFIGLQEYFIRLQEYFIELKVYHNALNIAPINKKLVLTKTLSYV